MVKEDLKAAVVEAMHEVLDPLFVDREQHYKDHLTLREMFGDRDQVDEHKNHHNFLAKWFDRTEKLGGKLFVWFVFGAIMFAISLTSGGFIAYLKALLVEAPVVGGFIRRK